jgi:hypothetical protein
MRALLPLLFLMAQPFWETRPPEQWSNAEIDEIRTHSPWAQPLPMGTPATAFLATALPVEHAEAELRLRTKKNPEPLNEPDIDYLDYLRDHREEVIVLGVTYPRMNTFGKPGEDKKMEEETVMAVGKKEHHILGHFPPTPSDPVLRLIFPRVVKPTDKSVVFRLYLPGLSFPEREVVFMVKDLLYEGKLAM